MEEHYTGVEGSTPTDASPFFVQNLHLHKNPLISVVYRAKLREGEGTPSERVT